MHKRQNGFLQFFERYPEAERHEHTHGNGMLSTISVGLFQGHVDGAFIGIYDGQGQLRSEENLPWDIVEESFGKNISPAELLSRLTETAVAKTGAPIIS